MRREKVNVGEGGGGGGGGDGEGRGKSSREICRLQKKKKILLSCVCYII